MEITGIEREGFKFYDFDGSLIKKGAILKMTKERLKSYQQLRKRERMLDEEIQYLEQELHSLRISYSNMPRGGRKKTMGDAIVELEYVKEQKELNRVQTYRELNEIQSFIEGIFYPKSQHTEVLMKNILYLQYVKGKEVSDIADELGYTHSHISGTILKISKLYLKPDSV